MTPDKYSDVTGEELARTGRALFGEQWKHQLAVALAISERSIRYMAAGERRLRQGIVDDLAVLLDGRLAEIRNLQKLLRRQV